MKRAIARRSRNYGAKITCGCTQITGPRVGAEDRPGAPIITQMAKEGTAVGESADAANGALPSKSPITWSLGSAGI